MSEEFKPVIDTAELGSDVTKEAIREKVWDYLESNNLASFPRPVKHRIPNFKGAAVAAEKAVTLDVFQKARTIKVNPDKPQQDVRFRILEANKTLLVPTPRLRQGLFNKIVPPEGCSKNVMKTCSTSQGVREYSEQLGLDDKVSVDLVVVGSVAVSPQGCRIGKGEGFADLEYAMMVAIGAVSADTVVVSTVHDCQVVDVPECLMGAHDMSVDYIVTPTQVMECPRRQKPTGIIWNLLNQEKLDKVPILKKLRFQEQQAGKDVRLAGEEERPLVEDVDLAELAAEAEEKDGTNGEEKPRKARNNRRRNRRPSRGSGSTPTLFVGGLPRAVRVSEFKGKVREKEVNPLRVIWHGNTGHAFLQFESKEEAESALDQLKDLSINDKPLRVELAKRNQPEDESEHHEDNVQDA